MAHDGEYFDEKQQVYPVEGSPASPQKRNVVNENQMRISAMKILHLQ